MLKKDFLPRTGEVVHIWLSTYLVTALDVKFNVNIAVILDILLKQFKKPNRMKYSVPKRQHSEYRVQFGTPENKKDIEILQRDQ